MQLPLSEEHTAFVKTLSRMVESSPETASRPGPRDVKPTFDGQLWDSLRSSGYLEAVAGPEGDGVLLGLLAEELGRNLAPVPVLSSVALAGTVLSAVAPQHPLTAAVNTGEQIAALCINSLATAPTVSGVVGQGEGTSRTVTGTVESVLGASHAQCLLFVVGEGDEVDLLSVAVQAGVDRLPRMFDPSRDIAAVSVNGAAAHRIASGPQVRDAVRKAIHVAALVEACEMTGGAQAALDLTVEHLKTRRQFGRALGSFQALQHACAGIAVENEAALAAVRAACRAYNAGSDQFELQALVAKSVAANAIDGAARGAVQMHGGMGFTWEVDAHRYLRRARSARARFFSPYACDARIAQTIMAARA
jgi:alkylation response protein AidB-like acyl-CoA dehydrogenase